MSETRILEKKSLNELFSKLVAAGQRVFAPVQSGERVEFDEVTTAQSLALDY